MPIAASDYSASEDADRLTEEQVADAFHSYLKSSLAQAKAERLLDTDMLSSAEADIMITGPALCLYFAALRCTTTPPSVPLPRTSKSSPLYDLSLTNCPPAFTPFLRVWSGTVPTIQTLVPEHQHDLARVICGLEPLSSPVNVGLPRIAAELRAVAIEISQRRTFQDRYAADLQAAIDAGEGGMGSGSGNGGGRSAKASFVPPPMYEPSPAPSPNRSPASTAGDLPPLPTIEPLHPHHPTQRRQYLDTKHLPVPPSPSAATTTTQYSRSRTPSPAPPSPSASSIASGSSSPSFLASSPAIQLIRETLYASLGDVLASRSYLRRLLTRDPARAYFASVSLAILDVAASRTSFIDRDDDDDSPSLPNPFDEHAGGHVRTLTSSTVSSHPSHHHSSSLSSQGEPCVTGILSATLTLSQTPPELRPFLREICEIGASVRAVEEEDSERAVALLQHASGGGELPEPTMDRVRRMLERGIEAEHRRANSGDSISNIIAAEGDVGEIGTTTTDQQRRRQSIEGRAITLTNRINALSLGMTKLRAFRERQTDVFKILASVR